MSNELTWYNLLNEPDTIVFYDFMQIDRRRLFDFCMSFKEFLDGFMKSRDALGILESI